MNWNWNHYPKARYDRYFTINEARELHGKDYKWIKKKEPKEYDGDARYDRDKEFELIK